MKTRKSGQSDNVDVVIVGGGGSGMAAALAAKEADSAASVVLLQQTDELGGTTSISIGSYTAAETTLQAEHGVEDSTEAHFTDIEKFISQSINSPRYLNLDRQGDLMDKDDLALRRLMVETGSDTLNWLREKGLKYNGPHPEPPHRVPRMHNVQPDTGAYADVLGSAIHEAGIDVRFETEATGLITDGNDLTGVRIANGDIITVDRGLVLSTGSYVANEQLREEFTTNQHAPPINEHGAGAGHEMARKVGAELVNMDLQWLSFRFGQPLWTEPVIPDLVDAGAILVTDEGHRYVNERSDYDQLFESTIDPGGGRGYILFDSHVAEQFTEWPNYISTFPGVAYGYLSDYADHHVLTEAAEPDALADSTGMHPKVLDRTIEAYNNAAIGARVDQYGRKEFAKPIEKPPYYALGPFYPHSLITDGGIKVNSRLEALDSDGAPINRLYAAGDAAGGPLRLGHGHHHLWAFTSGRIAGREAVTTISHG